MSRFNLGVMAALAVVSVGALAAEDSKLTYTGAERAGNAEGTIPAWTGGITELPAGYKVGDRHPDPFADDKVLFVIDHTNIDQHKDKVPAGYAVLMQKYPDTYRMKVYPTRRSANHPQRMIDGTKKYEGKARVVDGGAGIEGIVQGIPFPQPKNGQEAIWNSNASFKGGGVRRYLNSAIPTSDGSYQLKVQVQEVEYSMNAADTTLENLDNNLLRGINYTFAPAKDAGKMSLYYMNINSKDEERRNWSYSPGSRRVSRAPIPLHHTEMSEGVHLLDQGAIFYGAITDFDWTLLGKKEMIVPYNSYTLHSGDVLVDDIIQPGHMNQDLGRYELHRMWVVEANRKPGNSHPQKRRLYYLDEDSWRALVGVHYDNDGKLNRFSESHHVNYYDAKVFWSTLDTHYNFDMNRYALTGLDNQHPVNDFSFSEDLGYYNPNKLKMKATR